MMAREAVCDRVETGGGRTAERLGTPNPDNWAPIRVRLIVVFTIC